MRKGFRIIGIVSFIILSLSVALIAIVSREDEYYYTPDEYYGW